MNDLTNPTDATLFEFAHLLRTNHRNRNRRQIMIRLHQIAQAATRWRGFDAWRGADLEDAASEAVLQALHRLDRFDKRRDHAYGYFCRMIFRLIGKQLQSTRRRRRLVARVADLHQDGFDCGSNRWGEHHKMATALELGRPIC